jgi:hypothetical protein
MAIQWMLPPDLSSGLIGGEFINESSAGGLELMTPGGTFINEQTAAAAAFKAYWARNANTILGAGTV